MRDDSYRDDDYEDYDDQVDDDTGTSFFPYSGTIPLGWPGRTGQEAGPDKYGDQPYDDEPYGEETYDEDRYGDDHELGEGSWWDEGLISLLIVAGVVLFLIPEPATSGLGILLIGAGVVLWIIDWLA